MQPIARRPDTRAAVFLDRDGVVNDLVLDPRSRTPESPYRPEDVHIPAAAVAGMRLLRDAGLPLVIVSNQPAAAKGTADLAALAAVHDRIVEELLAVGVTLAGVGYCYHHPEGVIPGLSRRCACRKPQPGLILEAAEKLGIDPARSWMIGDADTDVEAGDRAGCRTILVENPSSAHRQKGSVRPTAVVADLSAAALLVIQSSS